jgi:hypothetical protein
MTNNKEPPILMKIFLALILMLSLESCMVNSNGNDSGSSIQYPKLDHADIVNKWGYPAEVILKKRDPKLGDYVVTWIYYIQDSDGLVSPVFYNFGSGKPLSTNSFVALKGRYRIMNTDKIEDLKLILAKRNEIKKTWPVWPD